MKKRILIHRIGRAAGWVCIGWVLAGGLFRSLFWASWEPVPGEPYGASDLVDLMFLFGILALCSVTLVLGLGISLVPKIRDFGLGARLMVTAVALPVLYYYVHSMIPIFRLW